MKYISVFFTVLLVWVAVILVAVFHPQETDLKVFIVANVCTLLLFMIGFSKK